MIWEYIKMVAMGVGFWAIGMFLFVTLWCLLCHINDIRADREMRRNIEKIDRRFW